MILSRLRILGAAALLSLGLVGCADPVGQRALIGGGIGAAGGAGIAALTGGPPWQGLPSAGPAARPWVP